MLHGSWSGLAHGRVNPIAPVVVALVGALLVPTGHPAIGVGLVIGAALALFNGVLLSGRVELAADQGDVGRALLVMQLGFIVTCTVIGLATIVIVHFSVPMAVADAIGFVVSQMAMLALFYFARAKTLDRVEGKV